jgi:hypothetical protein
MEMVHERPTFDRVSLMTTDRNPLGDQRCSFVHTKQTITMVVERNIKSRSSRAARARVVAESRQGSFVYRAGGERQLPCGNDCGSAVSLARARP